jgi:hypothetical protein
MISFASVYLDKSEAVVFSILAISISILIPKILIKYRYLRY